MGSKPTFWLSGRALEKVIDAILQLPEPFFAFNMESGLLTAREREVVSALTRGRSYEEAALELRISINTLRHHVRNAYRKSRLETAPGS
jgi:DNA-binding CsgD family transcriptional regulator